MPVGSFESGAGAINVSWWSRGDFEDRLVPLLMDVMRDHGLKVTFHLEPYNENRVDSYASDIQYLITEYGDKRHWDCQLLLRSADGEEGPVFRAFATILPRFGTDCHGRTTPVAMWRPDDVWRRQTDRVREMLRRDFDTVWLSPIRRTPVVFSRRDSTVVPRTPRSVHSSILSSRRAFSGT